MWNYERTEQSFEPITVGKHRVRIASAEKAVSQSGREMLKLTFDVSGTKTKLYNYVVFLEERPEITNRKLTQIFDSFDIADGDFNLNNWVGKVGAVDVKHDEEDRAVVNYYINKNKQGELPPWQEVGGQVNTSGMTEVPTTNDDDLPF